MKKPDWLTAEIAKQGMRVIDGASTRTEAVADLIAAIGAHPEHAASLIAAEADRELAKWLRANAAESPSSSQLLLFPEMPLRMRVAPDKSVEVAAMTAADLDHARNMLWARTQNQIDGAREAAEREREVFADFYAKVRPLLAGDMTVLDALARIEMAA